MALKNFVLIHGACSGKWIWDKVKPLLEKDGDQVTTVDLEGSGDNPTGIEKVASADQYSEPLLNVLENIPDGKKVILVGHGFGGINAAIAMDKYPEKVECAVFLNALMPDITNRPSYVIEKYLDSLDDWGDCDFSSYLIKKSDKSKVKCAISKTTLGPTFVRNNLFPSSSDGDYKRAMKKIRPGSFFLEPLGMRENFTAQGYGSIPRIFISCKHDTGVPAKFQGWEMQNFPVAKSFPMDSDHSPMYSDPSGLVGVLMEIAGMF